MQVHKSKKKAGERGGRKVVGASSQAAAAERETENKNCDGKGMIQGEQQRYEKRR
jgi:hypothetical protein